MAHELSLLVSYLLAGISVADVSSPGKELPSTLSPDLDDPASTAAALAAASAAAAAAAAGGSSSNSGSAAGGADEAPAPRRLKLHSCAQCELPVAARFDLPDPALRARAHMVLQEFETHYLPQHGPVCGAASVAGTALALMRHHGVDDGLAREAATVRRVQECYHALGVPNIFASSVAVGNATLKRCVMVRAQERERVRACARARVGRLRWGAAGGARERPISHERCSSPPLLARSLSAHPRARMPRRRCASIRSSRAAS
jgi:hypothetical protein